MEKHKPININKLNVGEIEFDCKVITPMFVGGTDKSKNELRASSIKGLLRFWWRAICGVNYNDSNTLYYEESLLFGSSDEKIGASNIEIHLLSDINTMPIKKYNPLPHKGNGFFMSGIEPNYNFKIKIVSNKFKIEFYKNLMILFSYLGGLGKRSRRGFGSFKITKINGESFSQNLNINKLYEFIQILPNEKYKINNNCIIFNNSCNINYPYIKKIYFGKYEKDFNNLLKNIGEGSHLFDCDYTGYARKRKCENNFKSKRFASPLYISVNHNENEGYFPIITQLNVVFDPDVKDIVYNDKTEKYIRFLL